MANLFQRFLNRASGVEAISQQLQNMQSNFSGLSQQNNLIQQQLMQSFRSQGGFAKYDYNNQIDYIRNGYNISSAVYSIVKKIAKSAATVPLKVYEVRDENAAKAYKALMSAPMNTGETIFKAKHLKQKAMQEVEENNPLQALLDNPNRADDKSTFYETLIGFKLLTGNSYVYTPKLDVGSDKGKVQEMYVMPSPFTALIVTPRFPKKVIGYELIIDGVSLLKSEDVIHMKYPNYDYSVDGQEMYGLAPLKAAYRTLQRSNSAELSSTSQFENGGPGVIVTNKSVASDDAGIELVGKIKEANETEYAGNRNRGKVKWSVGDIAAIPLGLSPVDLDILASEGWTFDMLCNVWGVSSVMFNSKASSTESNVKEMRKDFYTNACLPEVYAIRDAFNRHLTPLFNTNGKKYYIDVDISGIPELQPDMGEMSKWLGLSWWLTPNMRLEMQDYGKSTDPNMDKVWMPTGLVTMDDAAMTIEPIDPSLDASIANEDNLQ